MENTKEIYAHALGYLKANYINLALILLFVMVGFLLAKFIQRKTKNHLNNKSPNYITANFTSQIVGFVLRTIVVFTTLYLLGLSSFTNKLLAGAGLLTFVIGFALKDIGENFLAGIILAFKSPFKLDDLIEVNDIIGHVKDISIRETLLKTPDGKDVFLPNSIILKNPLYNYTIDGFLRYEFTVGIAYENNPTEAVKIVLDTIKKVDGVLTGERGPSVTVDELGTNSININVKFWIDTFQSTRRSAHHNIRSKLLNDVVQVLITNGFSLPASILEVKNYEPYGNLKLNVEQEIMDKERS